MSLAMQRVSTLLRPLVQSQKRHLHGTAPKRSMNLLKADEGGMATKVHHKINLLILAATPIAVATSPSLLTKPFDLVLGVALPVHAHIGMNYVITDYVPKAHRGAARGAMLAATAIAIVGLLKLNVAGAGITETVKATWKKPEVPEVEETA